MQKFEDKQQISPFSPAVPAAPTSSPPPESQLTARDPALQPQADGVAPLMAHWAESGKSAGATQSKDSQQTGPETPAHEDFKPAVGTKETSLKGTHGDFKVSHGLTKLPAGEAFGEYALKIEMTPNKSVGNSEIGFLQAFRVGESEKAWSTKKGDPYLSDSEGERVTKSGYAVDRANAKRDKTPLYGMYKNDKGELKQYSTTRVGKFGGPTAMMSDKPGIADPYKIEFSATATDIKNGSQFGAIAWGFEFNSSKKLFTEETPRLLDAGSDRLKGRDEAIEKWDKDVAGKDGIDKAPGK